MTSENTTPEDASDEVVFSPSGEANHGKIDQVELNVEMQRSYLDYAMSVIVGRALPDVRDGLKPVHRRVIYTMYDGGYRPDKAFSKCTRVIGDVMGQFHPHGDTAVYDSLVRLVQPWSLRYPLALGQGNFGPPVTTARPRTGIPRPRCLRSPWKWCAISTRRYVDFQDNYDGQTQEPTVLTSRFPNLLVNGSVGIAVGMATNIPPHNLREVASGAKWHLEHPDASREELFEALIERISGPRLPRRGPRFLRHERYPRRVSNRSRIDQDARGCEHGGDPGTATAWSSLSFPYQVNPDNLAVKIADLVKDGKVQGIADIRDETSGRTGQRLVIVLKRDAIPKVVLNNLYKHTQLQQLRREHACHRRRRAAHAVD